jgi:hypothetical protein
MASNDPTRPTNIDPRGVRFGRLSSPGRYVVAVSNSRSIPALALIGRLGPDETGKRSSVRFISAPRPRPFGGRQPVKGRPRWVCPPAAALRGGSSAQLGKLGGWGSASFSDGGLGQRASRSGGDAESMRGNPYDSCSAFGASRGQLVAIGCGSGGRGHSGGRLAVAGPRRNDAGECIPLSSMARW